MRPELRSSPLTSTQPPTTTSHGATSSPPISPTSSPDSTPPHLPGPSHKLPPDLPDIISRLDPPHLPRPSHKDLYLSLCTAGGGCSGWTGPPGRSATTSPRGSSPSCGGGIPAIGGGWKAPGDDQAGAWSSSFSEVARLLRVCWLLISAELDTRLLSHQTRYVAYLVLRLDADSYGLTWVMPTVFVTLGDQVSTNKALLTLSYDVRIAVDEEEGREEGEAAVLRERGDGWLELELGEFFNEAGDDGAVKMELRETEGGHWKKGLLIHGIEIRPKTANP